MEGLLAGAKLQRCRVAFLSVVPAPRRALLLGEGHGRFLTALLQKHPTAQCVCVDASQRMLDIARSHILQLGLGAASVEFVHADLTSWTPPTNSFDLIVTHFVLDCFTDEQLDAILASLAAAGTAELRLLAADFRQPEKGPARWRAGAILAVMYIFFRWATGIAAAKLPATDALLRKHGFMLCQRRISEWGLLQSDLWQKAPADH